jgi:hypothetical protein
LLGTCKALHSFPNKYIINKSLQFDPAGENDQYRLYNVLFIEALFFAAKNNPRKSIMSYPVCLIANLFHIESL